MMLDQPIDSQKRSSYRCIARSTQNRLNIHIQTRYMSDPPLSDIDFNDKMAGVWTTLKSSKEELVNGNQLAMNLKVLIELLINIELNFKFNFDQIKYSSISFK